MVVGIGNEMGGLGVGGEVGGEWRVGRLGEGG